MQVFVDEGEPAMFECRVEPKHDLNLSGILKPHNLNLSGILKPHNLNLSGILILAWPEPLMYSLTVEYLFCADRYC